jgi:hypothetical protein
MVLDIQILVFLQPLRGNQEKFGNVPSDLNTVLLYTGKTSKLLRSSEIDSKESIPPACVAGRYDNPIPTLFLVPVDFSKIPEIVHGLAM